MTGLGYGLFDCDTHCYETCDSFTRYLPEEWMPYAIAPVRLHDGTERILAADRIAVFPSAMALSVENYVKHVPAVYANVHSFNRWFDEEWGFSRDGKIFAPALLSLADRDLAVAELDHVLKRGARIIMLPTGPAYGRSPGDPYFDPSGRG